MSLSTLESGATAGAAGAADIGVVHTGEKHVLVNVPRSIEELAEATRPRPRGLKQRVAHFFGFYPHI